ncbi:MAG: HAMP domain-containing protein [Desulfobacteraceae bacterium]|nr:HAMP domain-containing protein [Desulfobacteraceae bacterium]
MTAFRDFSITNKIRTIVMIVSSITLLMACGILGALEVINFRQTQIHELSVLAKIIADRSTASLTFADPQIAHETLDALKAKHSILSAYIFNDAGEIFASYYRPGSDPDSLPTDLQLEGTGFNATSLHVISPVLLEEEKIGTVFIKSDLKQMYALIWKYIGYVTLVLFFAILTAFFMLTKLQRYITRPILDLANAAGLTAVNMDYSTRVTKKGNDEIGLLVDAFNAMMDQIKQRDIKLTESRKRAESSATKARELAKETKQINLKLEKEITERKRIYNALRNSEKELKNAYKQLEKRVDERTAELREANTELRKAIAAADEAANAKSEFLGNMSHEIRTPMNGVISAAELALSEEIPLKVEHYLKIIHSSGNALLSVINDILDFSKIDAGNLVLSSQPFRLDAILQNAITIFSSVTAKKDIELLLDIKANTPMDIIGDPLK